MPPYDYSLPKRRLVNQQDASIIERNDVPRSTFVGQKSRITAFDAGYLVPFLVDEILPGDHMRYNVDAYVRMATPLFPLFSQQRVDTHFFFVPYRLVWQHWVNMMGEQENPSSSINYTVPIVQTPLGGPGVGTLYDHFGIPGQGQVDGGVQLGINNLVARAYNLIYNLWFRDQNAENSIPVAVGDGPDTYTDYVLRRRNKFHDYFTMALPWAQKFTAPNIPLLGNAPVIGIGTSNTGAGVGGIINPAYETSGRGTAVYNPSIKTSNAAEVLYVKQEQIGGVYYPAVYADLSTATGVAINSLRQAWMVQSLLERDARGGTRYTELLQSHFGVRNPDARLQRPEYIGGGQSPLNVTPIAQTTPTGGNGLGALGGAGTASGSHSASYAATEHGVVLGLISVHTETRYQQGLNRMWTKQTRYDYPWPATMGLGEQTVLTGEIYCKGLAGDNVAFGYVPRWEEYRTFYSDVTGIMRSTAAGTTDAWHLADKYTSAPVLGNTFLEDNPPMTRILAAAGAAVGQEYLADIVINRTATRPLSMYGTPAQLGRF